jgi:putative peptidoglycan lipid II flippase
MSENVQVTKAAGVVGTATLLSRVLGFIRDVVIAWIFGAGFSTDAFFVAFRIPNLLRRLFAEGSLTIAFIPIFTEYLTNTGKEEAFKLAGSAFRVLSILLVVVALLGIALSPLIVKVIAPGFLETPEKFALTVTLTRIVFPYIFFIGLVALSMGILNALGHFTAPALAPVFLNLAMIGSVFLISPYLPGSIPPVVGLAVGVIIGGVLQLIFQIPFLVGKGCYFWKKTRLFHPGLKKIGLLMVPAVFGAAVYQINILINTLLASLLPEGSVSYLYYADRLVQFPLGIFAVAIATAVLPSLSKQAVVRDFDGLKETFIYAIQLVFFITIPAMVGLVLLREPIVVLLFKRGAFGLKASRLTAYALLYYGIGLWAFSAVRILYATFYALQDTRTPVRMAMISIAANIVLGIILMRPLLHGGLALATSLASMLNFGLLLRALGRKLGPLGLMRIAASLGKTAVCSGIMGAVVWIAANYVITRMPGTLFGLGIGLFGTIFLGLASYCGMAFLVKSPELETVWTIAKKGAVKQ